MSNFDDLRALDARVRPIDRWPGPETLNRTRSQFRTPLGKTLRLLGAELRHLQAKDIVLELDFREKDLRLDGLPRADARMLSPRVQIAFGSKYGPLKYATDTFRDWDDNLRAIALSMESLRAVDRYGVSKRGEQYAGWRALPFKSHEPADDILDAAQAQAFLDQWGGSFREAVKRLHPDTGSERNLELYRAAVRARDVLAGKELHG